MYCRTRRVVKDGGRYSASGCVFRTGGVTTLLQRTRHRARIPETLLKIGAVGTFGVSHARRAAQLDYTPEHEAQRREHMSFADQTIIVTGAFGGIGTEVARRLLEKGARVILTDRAGAAAAVPAEFGARASFAELDVTSEEAWQSVIDGAVATHGAIHGLVNIAGVFTPGIAFEDMTLAQWRHHLSVNLDGTFMGCRFATRAMAKTGGGSIVNFSSGLAHIMLSDAAAYCVSKAAVLALTRLAAKAGGKHRVRVNAVLPGAIDTPMLWGNLREGQAPQELIDMLVKQHPIGRIGVPGDVAQAVVFLLDPENSFITGALLAVDGGQLVD
jgi:3-oxoacyl-[acyl-carrier protein] reductase/3(or 17)beta-hydroxysteroid dehydrogenase